MDPEGRAIFAMMKSAGEWKDDLAPVEVPDHVERVRGRGADSSLKVKGVFLHSRYEPREEAARLVDSAGLDLKRPVLVIGLGLGYHVIELLARGVKVAVVEPEPAVAKLALEGPLQDADVLLGVGEPNDLADTEAFRRFAAEVPQVLVHPATARVHRGYAEGVSAQVSRCALEGKRLGVAVVGPMYGGSLPIAGYLERAFRKLGHRTLLADNSRGYDTYTGVQGTVKGKKASGQLAGMLVNFLGEWSYARVMEFAPDVCIVIAQAPVGAEFPARLANQGIVAAFWYIENWRHLGYWRDIARHYDYFFHIQPGEFEQRLADAGCTHHAVVPTGCDPDIHRPVTLTEDERAEFGCDLSFAGAGYYNRNQLFAGLTDHDLRIWGVDWTARELLPHVRKADQRFTPEQFAKIVAASKINLNLHSSALHPGVDPNCDAVNPRVFEVAACGGFQLCDPCKGLERFFDFEGELPVYRDLKELRARIEFYLAHPEERRRVAERARARALRDHTYERRAQQMLDLILAEYGARILNKGIRVQRTVAEAADRVGRDTALGEYLATLPPDMPLTQENVNKHIPLMDAELSRPEAVFAYLRELRNSAEGLLAGDG